METTNRTYDRNKLYEEVWKEPMTTVSKRYNIIVLILGIRSISF